MKNQWPGLWRRPCVIMKMWYFDASFYVHRFQCDNFAHHIARTSLSIDPRFQALNIAVINFQYMPHQISWQLQVFVNLGYTAKNTRGLRWHRKDSLFSALMKISLHLQFSAGLWIYLRTHSRRIFYFIFYTLFFISNVFFQVRLRCCLKILKMRPQILPKCCLFSSPASTK